IFAYRVGYDAKTVVLDFLLFIAYSITYFSICYLANDLSDVEDDRKAGKRNAFSETNIKVGIAAFIITSLIHFGIVLLISFKWQFVLFALMGYLFGISYSFKPFRFKERGVLGLVVASFFQRNLQLCIIPFMFSVDWIPFILINIGSFVYGIRFILIHQYMDYENDKISGTKTFVGKAKRITKQIIYSCVFIEIAVVFVAFSLVLADISYLYLWLLVAGYILEVLVWGLMRINKQKDIFTSYFYVPMNFVYLFALPAIACVLIATAELSVFYWAAIYLISLVLAFWKTIKFHFEYIVASVKKANTVYCCKRNSKITTVKNGGRFLNVTPCADDSIGIPELDGYFIVSPINIKIELQELLPYFSEHECVEVRYALPEAIKERIENEIQVFQTKNKDMRSFFSVYIFKKNDFYRFQKRTMSKTVFSLLSDCKDIVVHKVEFNSVEVTDTTRLNDKYAAFSGLACAELYPRRKDCFMTVFPLESLLFCVFSLFALFGFFFERTLFVFGVSFLILNFPLTFLIWILGIKSLGVGIKKQLIFNYFMYIKVSELRAVPFYKVYGIYTDKIVNRANEKRKMFSVALISLLISFCVALFIKIV
ncbi:MAG: UbiA family prenyltransferase, partial [Clostridia bacterium]|nr:UbiA family prenyltransferase [Clostridia bacterium]